MNKEPEEFGPRLNETEYWTQYYNNMPFNVLNNQWKLMNSLRDRPDCTGTKPHDGLSITQADVRIESPQTVTDEEVLANIGEIIADHNSSTPGEKAALFIGEALFSEDAAVVTMIPSLL